MKNKTICNWCGNKIFNCICKLGKCIHGSYDPDNCKTCLRFKRKTIAVRL